MKKEEKMSLNYIGSKLSLLDFIHFVFDKEVKKKIKTVGDLFAGTGIVGLSFKKKGFKVIANDIQYYSYIINKKFIGINKILKFHGLDDEVPLLKKYKGKEKILTVLKFLNNLPLKNKGFIRSASKGRSFVLTTTKKFNQYFGKKSKK